MTDNMMLTLEKLITEHLQNNSMMIIAIDGPSGSGKTTLAHNLALLRPSTIISLDDFFLPPTKKTTQRLLTPGGNVDYERFKKEVVNHLNNKKIIKYHRYYCNHDVYEKIKVKVNPLVIVEGVYSAHPYFGDYFDFLIYLDINFENQLERIRIRSGSDLLNRFIKEWIPQENKYFAHYNIKEKANLIIKND